jgi:hypothetical protein
LSQTTLQINFKKPNRLFFLIAITMSSPIGVQQIIFSIQPNNTRARQTARKIKICFFFHTRLPSSAVAVVGP